MHVYLHTHTWTHTQYFMADGIETHHNWEIQVHSPFKYHLEFVPIIQIILVIQV